ncbi:hypothetical protein JIN85_16775 [Luteolibacter pohnpeiensis]|uniref:SnoaL-like domain-containing protein n=1 Tax=Luteolibacter pohnpeiensis TaxID=454153 RepID=A0A934VSA3_9BACT|nr:hypothetical protein [Luteolibacter pohnpeiensis]MBK1884076.1 hypothetical protein [Luteolibacter pohnpeiensis]
MKRGIYFIMVVAVIVGFMAWWFSPVQVLKRRTSGLFDTLTLERDSAPAYRHLKELAIGSKLADYVTLEAPSIGDVNGRFERSQLESGFSFLSSNAIESAFEDEKFVSVTSDGETGTVVVELTGLVALKEYRPVDGRFHVELNWKKSDDGWRLEKASWKEIP